MIIYVFFPYDWCYDIVSKKRFRSKVSQGGEKIHGKSKEEGKEEDSKEKEKIRYIKL